MANWGYALAQGVKGFADAGVKVADDAMKTNAAIEAEKRLADRQVDVHTRQKAVDELMNIRADEYKRTQAAKTGAQIEEKAGGMLAESDRAAINSSLGSNMTAEDFKNSGIVGNEAARAAYGLPEETEAAKIGRKSEAAGLLGATQQQKELYDRKKDIESAARYDKADETANRRIDTMDDHNREMEKRQQKSADAQLEFAKARAKKQDDAQATADAREYRQTMVGLAKSANDDIKTLEAEAKELPMNMDLNADEKKKRGAAIVAAIAARRDEVANYRQRMSASVAEYDGTAKPANLPPFSPTNWQLPNAAKVGASVAPGAGPAPVVAPAVVPADATAGPPAPTGMLAPASPATFARDYNWLNSDSEVAAGVARGEASAIAEAARRKEANKRKRGGAS